MNKIIQHARLFFSGKIPMNSNLKYYLIIYPVAALHGILGIFFLCLHIPPLAYYNLLSVVFYLYCSTFIKQQAFSLIYYFTCIEVILFVIFSTLFVGFQVGIVLYLFALIPACFYISHTFPQKQIASSVIMSFFILFTFAFCYFFSTIYEAPYALMPDSIITHLIYFFNIICTFGLQVLICVFFMLEVRFSETKLSKENQTLGKAAQFDHLTGLYNRWSMQEYLENATNSDRPFCIVMCDIDDFKHINDTYGHDSGDEVLKHISKIISSKLPSNSYVSRWGGEEFLILLNNLSLEASYALMDNIRSQIAASHTQVGDLTITHTMTMGLTSHIPGNSIDTTISTSDKYLYIGKRNGKNAVIFKE